MKFKCTLKFIGIYNIWLKNYTKIWWEILYNDGNSRLFIVDLMKEKGLKYKLPEKENRS